LAQKTPPCAGICHLHLHTHILTRTAFRTSRQWYSFFQHLFLSPLLTESPISEFTWNTQNKTCPLRIFKSHPSPT
jgi:hypothetical protein